MELRHLRYFIAVAEELHFGRAARRMHIAQPPLSQQIRGLEEELGLKLFHRTSRKVELTPAGAVFLEHARLTLTQAARASDMARAAQRGEAGRITIGFVASAVYTVVPAILREFHLRRPQVEMRCREMPPPRQIEALHQRAMDVAFLRIPVRDHALSSEILLKEPLVLALPAEHPRAGAATARLADFKDESFVMVPRLNAPIYHEITFGACQRAGFTPRITQEADEMQTMLALVAAGLGVALVPQSLRNWQRPGVVYRELQGRPGDVPLFVVWRRSADPLTESFVAVAQDVARAVTGAKRA